MSDGCWRAVFIATLGPVVACGRVGAEGGAPEPAANVEDFSSNDVKERPPDPSLASLGPAGRRVKVLVRPGDASVEVDGFIARRRDGVIELTGKVGEVHRLRVTMGSQQLEKEVTIQDKGASPASLDLAELLAVGSSTGPGGAAKPAGPAKPDDVLLPEDFD